MREKKTRERKRRGFSTAAEPGLGVERRQGWVLLQDDVGVDVVLCMGTQAERRAAGRTEQAKRDEGGTAGTRVSARADPGEFSTAQWTSRCGQ